MHKLRLFTAKTYPNFVRIDHFLLDLYPEQVPRPTDRQTLNFRMATKLAIVPKWKGDFSNNEKFIKIAAFFQMLSWNKGIAWTKIREKIVKKIKTIKKNSKIQVSGGHI